MTMAERICERRKELGFTQEELALALGLQKAALAKYERGRVENIKQAVLLKMAELLRCTPAYLMGWSNIPAEPDSSLPHVSAEMLTEEQQLMIDLFSSVNADNRAWVLEYCRRLKKVQEMEDVLSS